jgi:hypothetical protein
MEREREFGSLEEFEIFCREMGPLWKKLQIGHGEYLSLELPAWLLKAAREGADERAAAREGKSRPPAHASSRGPRRGRGVGPSGSGTPGPAGPR